MYYTYILQSEKDNSYYIGYTQQLQKRIRQHNKGKSNFTSKHRPYKLVYYETFKEKSKANHSVILKECRIGKNKASKYLKHLECMGYIEKRHDGYGVWYKINNKEQNAK